jgi:hypothetical protein
VLLSLVFAGLVGLGGCGDDPPAVALVLRGVDLDPRSGLGPLRVVLVDAEGGAVVAAATVTAPELDTAARVLASDALEPGRRYRALVGAADVGEPCANGRAVGRSRVFALGRPGPTEADAAGDDGTQEVLVPIACAEQLVRPRGGPEAGRIGHALVATGDGALLLAGARTFDAAASFPTPQVDELVPRVERFDPITATFLPERPLIVPRTSPAVASLPEQEGEEEEAAAEGGSGAAIVLLGGGTDAAPGCLTEVERFAPAGGRPGAPLPFPRCNPAAARIPGTGELLLAGGRVVARDPPFLLLPGELEGPPRTPVGARGVRRREPVVLPLADGTSALVVGGTSPTELAPNPPAVEVVRTAGCPGEGGGADAACVETATFVRGPGPGLADATATWVPCLEEGEGGGGAVYLAGGRSGATAETVEVLDGVWCHRDRADGAPVVFVPAGRLDRPRSGHEATFLPEPVPRLFLVGGTSATVSAVTLTVDGCRCAAARREEAVAPLVLPWAGEATGARAVTIADGAVLVVGGIVRPPGSLVFEATGEAALFYPDFPPSFWDAAE